MRHQAFTYNDELNAMGLIRGSPCVAIEGRKRFAVPSFFYKRRRSVFCYKT